jgi:hypothetical protein
MMHPLLPLLFSHKLFLYSYLSLGHGDIVCYLLSVISYISYLKEIEKSFEKLKQFEIDKICTEQDFFVFNDQE